MDYLGGRMQRVIANNRALEELTVRSGVPQGSVLGLVLFLILIDSITELDITSTMGIFADDTRIIRQIWSETDASCLQTDLELLYEWAKSNNMMFNGEKFECLKSGEDNNLKNEYNYTTPDWTDSIEDVDNLRDLVLLSLNLETSESISTR